MNNVLVEALSGSHMVLENEIWTQIIHLMNVDAERVHYKRQLYRQQIILKQIREVNTVYNISLNYRIRNGCNEKQTKPKAAPPIQVCESVPEVDWERVVYLCCLFVYSWCLHCQKWRAAAYLEANLEVK